MKIETGQFWVHVDFPSRAYEITGIKTSSGKVISTLVSSWYRSEGGQLNYIGANRILVVERKEFYKWHLVYDKN